MMRDGDRFVLILIVLVAIVWAWMVIKRRAGVTGIADVKYHKPWNPEPDDEIWVTEAVELLEDEGYEVLTNKRKVPMSITIDGNMCVQAGLYVDHFAQKDGAYYVVKLASESRPLEFSAKGLRDQLLVYHLMYPDAAGILAVDADERQIHLIEFELEDQEE